MGPSYATAPDSQSASLALLAAKPFATFSVDTDRKADVIQTEGHSVKTGLALLHKLETSRR
jgi:hypothetical protein